MWVLDHPARATFWVRAATTLISPKEEDASLLVWGERLLESNKKCHTHGTSSTTSVQQWEIILAVKSHSFLKEMVSVGCSWCRDHASLCFILWEGSNRSNAPLVCEPIHSASMTFLSNQPEATFLELENCRFSQL